MKLEYLNFTSIKKFARRKDRRLSTAFVQAVDDHCSQVLEAVAVAGKDSTTFTPEHVAIAMQTIK